jgi:3,4-dihydroxy 2-butanone 4-phosphate synthase/GTP cyclohydrolase II
MSWPIDKALEKIAAESGVMVLLSTDDDADNLLEQVKAFALEDRGQTPSKKQQQVASRTVGVGSQILADLGVSKMRLLSSPKRYHALSGFGLEVIEYIDQE